MRGATVAVLALGLASCGKPSAGAGSCFRPQDNLCIDYAAAQAPAGKRLCAGLRWTEAPCATDKRLGTCTKPDVTEHYYSGAPNNYDAPGAKLACEHASGTWR